MAKKNYDDENYLVDEFKNDNQTNPYYTAMFSQPAKVNSEEFEFRTILRNELHNFPNHPFKVKIDNDMFDLRDSIVDNGILQPLIVTPRMNGGYTIISGHRRNKAAELAQLDSVPCVIAKNISDNQAIIMMVDSNKQRELILPSERAKSLQMKMEAMSRQPGRPKKDDIENGAPVGHNFEENNNSAPMGRNLESREIIAQEENISKNTVSRYIRLNSLIPQLLDLVDNDALKQSPSMAFRPAVEISYLKPDEQKYFYDTIKALGKTPSVQQATDIKNLSKNGELTQTKVMNILVTDKPNQKETVKVDYERLGGYFKERLTPKQCESKVFEKLDAMAKIREVVDKYTKASGKILNDNEVVKLVDNLLGKYAKAQNHNRDMVR